MVWTILLKKIVATVGHLQKLASHLGLGSGQTGAFCVSLHDDLTTCKFVSNNQVNVELRKKTLFQSINRYFKRSYDEKCFSINYVLSSEFDWGGGYVNLISLAQKWVFFIMAPQRAIIQKSSNFVFHYLANFGTFFTAFHKE